MELDTGGWGCFVVVGIVGLLVVGFAVAASMDATNAAVERDYAKAAIIQAQANVERERGEAAVNLEAVREENFERRFVMWTTAMASFSGSNQGLLIALAVALGAVVAAVAVRWMQRKEVF